MPNAALGIDVAKASLEITLLNGSKEKHASFPNTTDGIEKLQAWIKLSIQDSVHICLEATGRYGQLPATLLSMAGYPVSVVNPLQIKGFAKSQMSRTKNDRQDSRLIAQFCQKMKPPIWKSAPAHETLKEMTRRREQLRDCLVEEKTRLKDGRSIVANLASCERHITFLKQEIALIDKEIDSLIKSSETLNSAMKLLCSIPGIGRVTAACILAEGGDWRRFDDVRQYVAYAGLCPKEHQSGSSINKTSRLSKMGNQRLRKALYLPALTAMQHNPILKATAERLITQGKPAMVAVGAVMRKLLHIAYGVLKSGKPFDPTIATQTISKTVEFA